MDSRSISHSRFHDIWQKVLFISSHFRLHLAEKQEQQVMQTG